MIFNLRLKAFEDLGKHLQTMPDTTLDNLTRQVANQNPWFTPQNIKLAFDGLIQMLSPEKLGKWMAEGQYQPHPSVPKRVGVVMAGNIPMVGFHDMLCVLLSGHQLVIKPSSQDAILIHYLTEALMELEPQFNSIISFSERLNHCDAFIATGSDNSARYFEYYFRNKPHLIRKNRSSCAVLDGTESPKEREALGKDIFSHFGLGCRNVSKLYLPESYEFDHLFEFWNSFETVIHHHKYANNYDYQKSILLVNRMPFLDTGFVLLTPNEQLVSPISTVFYEYYNNPDDLHQKLNVHIDKIQCIVSGKWFKKGIPFGQAQLPEVWDYADQVDTLAFLDQL